MSWGAQNRSKDAKTPSAGRVMSRNPKLALCGIQPYLRYTTRSIAVDKLSFSSFLSFHGGATLDLECLGPVLQLPPRHWQRHGCNDGLKVQPECATLLIDTIGGYCEWSWW
jgi:hypothetical protein